MKFAKWVFAIAGVYGILVIAPLYVLETQLNTALPPPLNHPEYYYGFIGITLAWEFLFLVLSRDPVRYRLMMLPAMFEKFSFPIAVIVLVMQGRTSSSFLLLPSIDVIWGILFVISFWLTREKTPSH